MPDEVLEKAQQVTEVPDATRREKRTLDRLRVEKAEADGRASAYREMLERNAAHGVPATGTQPLIADAEPNRKDFPDDAAFNRALGRWDARQEVKKATDDLRSETGRNAALESLKSEIEEANGPAEEAIKDFYPDFEAKREADDEDGVKIDTSKENEALVALTILKSPVRAHLQYYFFDHQDEFKEILAIKDQVKAVAKISRLEGRLEREYADKQKQPKQETAAERDARRPPPSEAGSPRGGTAPPSKIEPLLANGKLNPAWKSQRNAESGIRK